MPESYSSNQAEHFSTLLVQVHPVGIHLKKQKKVPTLLAVLCIRHWALKLVCDAEWHVLEVARVALIYIYNTTLSWNGLGKLACFKSRHKVTLYQQASRKRPSAQAICCIVAWNCLNNASWQQWPGRASRVVLHFFLAVIRNSEGRPSHVWAARTSKVLNDASIKVHITRWGACQASVC